MKINVIKNIKFDACKSPFSLKLDDKKSLPHYAEFINFVSEHSLASCLVIVDRYCSLEELSDEIINASQKVKQYFYIAFNKYYIYSNKDLNISSQDNYDLQLVNYCYDLIKDQFELINTSVRPDDHGQLGNYVHPVTSLILKRHDKTSN